MEATEGPWEQVGMTIYGPDDKPLAEAAWAGMTDTLTIEDCRAFYDRSERTEKEALANARLIASAPALLAFVEALILDYDKTEGQITSKRPEWYVRARMEAAAARGEAAGAEGGRR